MTSSARRNPLRELAPLMRAAPEPGSSNLGEFVADNATELAQVLGIDPLWLEAVRATDDEEVVSRIRQLLARGRDQRVQQDLERRRQRSLEAATRLGVTARWTDLGAELDVDLLLGHVLADRTKKWVSFVDESGPATIIPRHLLAATVPLRRIYLDLAAWVDPEGLHFRWKGGRGGYNWKAHQLRGALAEAVLTVPLAPKVVVQVPERRRGGAWLGDVLREMGFSNGE